MKKNEFKKKIDAAESKKKVDEGYIPARINPVIEFLHNTWDFLKTKGLTLLVAAGIAVGGATLTACNNDKQPSEPVDPNPPIVTPIEPEEPGPVDPDPEKPGPEEPELTEEQKRELIVQNVYAAVQPKFTQVLGRNLTINSVYAVDYVSTKDENSVYMLMETSNTNEHLVQLVRFPMDTELTEKNLLDGSLTAGSGARRVLSANADILENANNEISQGIYSKLMADELLESKGTPQFASYNYGGGATDDILGGYTRLNFYTLTNNELERTDFAVKSDVSTNGFITDHLINGTFGQTYKQVTENSFYHKFSDNAIINLEGLTYEKQTEEVTALTYKVRKVGTYNNGRVYINLDDEQQI